MNEEIKSAKAKHHFRFLAANNHLASAFGNDWFGRKAENFARIFGTPKFLIVQTVLVATWIVLNQTGVTSFDIYPFILLNLAFSLQAAYAAPLILLAQTRQADRDNAAAQADALHRGAVAAESEARSKQLVAQSTQLFELLQRNTELTELTENLTQRIAQLTDALHEKVVVADSGSTPAGS